MQYNGCSSSADSNFDYTHQLHHPFQSPIQ